MHKQRSGFLKLGVALLLLTIVTLLSNHFVGNLAKTETGLKDISVREAVRLLQDNKNETNFVILDVRTPKEFFGGRLANAVNLDYYRADFRDYLNQLDKSKTYLVYCRTGRRSKLVLGIMGEMGFGEAYNMVGGIVQWQAEGLPLSP